MAFCAAMWSTRLGPGVCPDSTAYLQLARSEPVTLQISHTHFPPLYPLILRAGSWVAGSELRAGRVMNAVLFALNVLLVGVLLYRHARVSLWTGLAGTLLFIFYPDSLNIHTMLWSEPLFIALTLAGILSGANYIVRQRTFDLVATCVLLGLALLTRYAGVAAIAAISLGILVLSNEMGLRRLAKASVFAAFSILPTLLWVLFAGMQDDSRARMLVWHPITPEQIAMGLKVVSTWFLPYQWSGPWSGLMMIPILVALLLAGFLKGGKTERGRATVMYLLTFFILFYIFMLALSISLADAHTLLNNRILSPVLTTGIILVFCVLHALRTPEGRHWGRQILELLLFLVILLQGQRCAQYIADLRRSGQEFTSAQWRDSEILERVRHLPKGLRIYSNVPELVVFCTARDSKSVPFIESPITTRDNERYRTELLSMTAEIHKGNACVVYFDAMAWRTYLPTKAELASQEGITAIYTGNDGVILANDTTP